MNAFLMFLWSRTRYGSGIAGTHTNNLGKKGWERPRQYLARTFREAFPLQVDLMNHSQHIPLHSPSQRNVNPIARLFHAINTLLHFDDFLKPLASTWFVRRPSPQQHALIWPMNEGENTEELTLP